MPVLKAHHYRAAGKDAVVLDLGDLGKQAAKIRQAAEQKAQAILADAHEQAARLGQGAEEQGKLQGHAQGLEQGLNEGRKQGHEDARQSHDDALKTLQNQWDQALAAFHQTREQYFREARTATLKLAVTLAKKIVHRAANTDDQVALDQAAAALSRVLEPASVKLRCCPDDHALLQESLPDLANQFANITGIELIQDDAITPGGCTIACGVGQIDATIETQLQRLTALLLGETDPPPPLPEHETPGPNKTDPPPDETRAL